MKLSINISFLLVLFIFSINHVLRIVDKTDVNENRKLADKPKIDINRLDYYPSKYESYLNDNFAGRSYFVEFYGWLNSNILHKKTLSKRYILGEENYIFSMPKSLPLYTGKRSVTEEQLNRIGKEFLERQIYFKSKGVKMYIQVIPSKYKVHSDKLPLLLHKGKNHMGDRFVKFFRENTTIPIIDGTVIMADKRIKESVYLKYDTHWSKLGAFYVHSVLIDSMKKDFPEMLEMDTAKYFITAFEKEGGNMKWVAPNKEDMDFGFKIKPKNKTFKKAEGYVHTMADFRYGQDQYCIRYKSDNTQLPKVLMIRDSFGSFTLSFLPESFRETLFIWDDWKYKFNKDIVDIENPVAIVYSFYEGYIDRILMEPSFVIPNEEERDIQ